MHRSSQLLHGVACLLLAVSAATAGGRRVAKADIERWIRDLRSGSGTRRSKAAVSLVKTGPAAAQLLSDAVVKGPVQFRLDVIEVLDRIDCGDSDWAIADAAVSDRDSAVRDRALKALREGKGEAARDRLVELARDRSPKTRQRAAEVIRAAGAVEAVDELIRQLEHELPLDGAKATVSVRAERSDFRGYDDHSTTYNIQTPQGPRKVTQKHLMPVIGSTTVETTVIIGLTKGLETITRQKFGKDIRKWQAWWRRHRADFGGGAAPAPTR